ncbi:MAG TPA: TetR/AcrR family transcriptional regulator [Micropruina sp.]|nr:TetR/AcrR family transcriptional regulator [Micropruina sp.]HMR20815.1 TetR/AcrR family transcriptional regulator [Micropruina sp.]
MKTSLAKTPVDGRDTRWTEHRLQRRRELVESALRAIRRHGATVGMDDIAAEAGTSKPVIYRHFGDRPGLYRAVVEKVAQFILDDLRASVGWDTAFDADGDDVTRLIRDLTLSYLRLVQRDPEIYRFVLSRPLVDGDDADDPVTGLTMRIGGRIAEKLRANGVPAARADTWGHGLVGCVRAATDQWIRDGMNRPATDVADDLCDLLGPAYHANRTTLEGHR